jgi:hypothetical protein
MRRCRLTDARNTAASGVVREATAEHGQVRAAYGEAEEFLQGIVLVVPGSGGRAAADDERIHCGGRDATQRRLGANCPAEAAEPTTLRFVALAKCWRAFARVSLKPLII